VLVLQSSAFMRQAWVAVLLLLLTSGRPAIAQPVITDSNDLLSLIALPLAVSAVANIEGVPLDELSNLVGVLNDGAVPPQQMIEVLRYAPVALVADVGQPRFVPFVRTQVSEGVTGVQLVNAIEQRLRTYDVTPQIASSRVTVIDEKFIPSDVRTRVEKGRTHPHGGPPGQLKKTAGVQTGAEIVHGEKPGHRQKAAKQREREAKKHGNGHGNGKGKHKGKG
jgi:hypothetical protein